MLVDLRSDTVTRPSAEMRRAMVDAEVGDDGFGDDPTVRRLEEMFAARVGKEAALFVPSGTMGNQIAYRLLGRPGSAVVAGRHQHIVAFEAGAAGTNGPATLITVDDMDGTLDPAGVAWLVEAGRDHHNIPVSAIFVESTHMSMGGRCWPVARLAEIGALGVPVHLDGARLFNAEIASGAPAAEHAASAVTVMTCLSKGLGAPVGSLLAGPSDLISVARVDRKRLGGGMRQVGILAAAGLWALEHNVERLADDHARARRLAEAIAERWPACGLDPADVETNCVVFQHDHPHELVASLADDGVLAVTIGPKTVRMVTHLDVDDDQIALACKAIAVAP